MDIIGGGGFNPFMGGPMNWNDMSPYFQKSEFDCKCGCGKNNMDEKTMSMLLESRIETDLAYVVRSGSRCDSHNKDEGGSETSAHPKGFGVDVETLTSSARFNILFSLHKVGFRRFGIGKDFIHADNYNIPEKTQNIIWLY